MRLRTLKLTIAYIGKRYAGWQVQKNSIQQSAFSNQRKQKPTVQGTLEEALQRIVQEPVRVIGSGRTDSGVHALSQVAHIKIRSTISCRKLLGGLNHLLPSDISVMDVQQVSDDFHARFDALRKCYRYRVFIGSVASPFIRPYVYPISAPLNLSKMRREAIHLRGRHNFRAFAHIGKRAMTTKRALFKAQVRRVGDELHFEFEGNGFLHTMVRSMVGTLLDVGRGRLPEGTIQRLLKTHKRELSGTTAPPQGLTLVSVTYGKE
ncbi:MAG: tRNA pseudouridine(38-40) synthase TruA [Candidatus Omnitrophica bacterium]|nr:tRNA pseudouridine(38-40) synthase TruA [Candidatus Omnitrophota bacterium]MBI3009931.1 tRNA pseudouridine(38-40) synthase TruA [Candidatus Omnitrophota bacterium]